MQLIDNLTDVGGNLPKATLTDNARTVLAKRYLKRDENGVVCEEPEDMFWRVATSVASAEEKYGKTEEEIHTLAFQFYEMMRTGKWLPNSPTLFNAGRKFGQLSACFVLPIEDRLVGGGAAIYSTLEHMAAIHQSGGGTGFSFSKIRPEGDIVKSTSGVASGPVSFMRLYDSSTDVVKQGGNRRGANMGILRVDHPDIMQFITCKADTSEITNFNISVAVTDEFMRAVRQDEMYDLVSPKDGEVVGELRATEVFDKIVAQAHATGEPGLFFIDEANRHNPVPHIGEYEATNPCGEQPLLSYDVCNLGSLNIGHPDFMKEDGTPNWIEIEAVQGLAIRFLDNVIDINQYPLPEIRERSDAIRRIGAGVMGWADYLIRRGIPYDSEEALEEADKIGAMLHSIGQLASQDLAEERGVFPEWEKSIWGPDETCARDAMGHRIRPKRRLRNCNIDTVAPTGTISIIAGCSGGIEPLFAVAFKRMQADEIMYEYHPEYEKMLKAAGFQDIERVVKETIDEGHIPDYVPDEIHKIFRTSHDIPPHMHIKMQAAWQENIDSAISKTINFAEEATVEDVRAGYFLAHELDCKGVTVYRDGSRPGQVLSTGKTGKTEEAPKPEPRRKANRPAYLSGLTFNTPTPLGTLYVTINDLDGDPFEVFVNLGKAGGAANADAEAIGRLISLSLRHGVPMREIYAQLRGISSDKASGVGQNKVCSTPDGVAILMQEYLEVMNGGEIELDDHPNGVNDTAEIKPCPECSLSLTFEEGCAKCHSCGYAECG